MLVKILIVDDDLGIVRSLGNTFTTILRGYRLFTATTANQGLNYIKEEKPDVIIMDVRLGLVSGMDLLEDYPKHTPDYKPHLIVITAYPDEAVKKRAEALGVDAFFYKPFRPEALTAAVCDSVEKCCESLRREARFVAESLRRKLKEQDDTKKDLTDTPPENP